VGTIASYFNAGLQLTQPIPPFDFYDSTRPVYTHARFLPATRIEGCTLNGALVSEGCILMGAEIERSVIGIRSRIGQGTRVKDSLVLGADDYETLEEIDRAHARGVPPIGIGGDSLVQHAIIDKNARIGRGVQILNQAGTQHADGPGYHIREGIVIVPKGAAIPDGTVI
jgi:glucose-1-phosphate adenylyltransferase